MLISKSMIFAIVFMSHESPLLIGIRNVVVGVVESISEPSLGRKWRDDDGGGEIAMTAVN